CAKVHYSGYALGRSLFDYW
nr:immunoglobulin heavy chain junction region [Macaca mulatta]MOV38534.1 immunoglobulin heavy chain junction region [Macaca mulatta]MOV39961.1 immunoglobulin heavy chain junction region [Macaca mulatta]MOV40398.1 immunoglobulin heavy chain junction region [Macaca mulatta]MOV40502.1 immunoglobulin heavy chain junction region [Macaca mulatta]